MQSSAADEIGHENTDIEARNVTCSLDYDVADGRIFQCLVWGRSCSVSDVLENDSCIQVDTVVRNVTEVTVRYCFDLATSRGSLLEEPGSADGKEGDAVPRDFEICMKIGELLLQPSLIAFGETRVLCDI